MTFTIHNEGTKYRKASEDTKLLENLRLGFAGADMVSLLEFRANSGFGENKAYRIMKDGIEREAIFKKRFVGETGAVTRYFFTSEGSKKSDDGMKKRKKKGMEKGTGKGGVGKHEISPGEKKSPISLLRLAEMNKYLKTQDKRKTEKCDGVGNAESDGLKNAQKQGTNARIGSETTQHPNQPAKSTGDPLKRGNGNWVTLSIFDGVSIRPHMQTFMLKKYDQIQILKAVKRILKWKNRDNDEAALWHALRNADRWIDYEPKDSQLSKDRRLLRTLIDEFHGMQGVHIDSEGTYIKREHKTGYEMYMAGTENFQENTRKLLEKVSDNVPEFGPMIYGDTLEAPIVENLPEKTVEAPITPKMEQSAPKDSEKIRPIQQAETTNISAEVMLKVLTHITGEAIDDDAFLKVTEHAVSFVTEKGNRFRAGQFDPSLGLFSARDAGFVRNVWEHLVQYDKIGVVKNAICV